MFFHCATIGSLPCQCNNSHLSCSPTEWVKPVKMDISNSSTLLLLLSYCYFFRCQNKFNLKWWSVLYDPQPRSDSNLDPHNSSLYSRTIVSNLWIDSFYLFFSKLFADRMPMGCSLIFNKHWSIASSNVIVTQLLSSFYHFFRKQSFS